MYRNKYAHQKTKHVGMEAMIIFGLLYFTFFLWSFLFMTVPHFSEAHPDSSRPWRSPKISTAPGTENPTTE